MKRDGRDYQTCRDCHPCGSTHRFARSVQSHLCHHRFRKHLLRHFALPDEQAETGTSVLKRIGGIIRSTGLRLHSKGGRYCHTCSMCGGYLYRLRTACLSGSGHFSRPSGNSARVTASVCTAGATHRKIARTIIVALVFVLFLFVPASAAQDEEINLPLPQELTQLIESQADHTALVQSNDAGSLFQQLLDALRRASLQPISMLGKIAAVLVLAAVARAFVPEDNSLSIAPQIDTVVTVTVFFLVCEPLLALLEDLENAICECRNFLITFVPAFSALLTGAGQPAAGIVFSGFFLSGALLCAQMICSVLLPLVKVFLAFNITAGVTDEIDLSGFSSLILRFVRQVLTICAGAFSAVMCLQKIFAGATDTLAKKAGKFVVGSAVPVIGRAVSDAMSTVYASMDVIKSTAGIAGICAMVAIFTPVLLRCLLYYAVLYLGMVMATLTGNKRCSATFSGFCSCVELYAAILVFFAVIILVSTALLLTIGR